MCSNHEVQLRERGVSAVLLRDVADAAWRRPDEDLDGGNSPVRGIYGLWILLPLIGPIIWFVQVQGALNRYWESKGASPA